MRVFPCPFPLSMTLGRSIMCMVRTRLLAGCRWWSHCPGGRTHLQKCLAFFPTKIKDVLYDLLST